MTTEEAISVLEAKGYIVRGGDNYEFGKINQRCPYSYNIYNPDFTHVYGTNDTSPEHLPVLAEYLRDLNDKKSEIVVARKVRTAEEATERKTKEREYDNTYNEGAEGYNPYRA